MVVKKGRVVRGVSKWVEWWIEQRKLKLSKHLSSSMTINPLMLPIVFELHNLKNFNELSDLFVGAHLMTGYSTGFGKLIDEKILPDVFGTIKIDAEHRRGNPPLMESCFDEIDHIIPKHRGKDDLLSLKASKWTIQLTMAVQLNSAFKEITDRFSGKYKKIVVGVIYGKSDDLTDKYDILRGINRGKKHNVTDITDRVCVYAGKDFWSWLNGGEVRTQKWLLDGIMTGIKKSESGKDCKNLLKRFKSRIRKDYSHHMKPDGEIGWASLLKEISG